MIDYFAMAEEVVKTNPPTGREKETTPAIVYELGYHVLPSIEESQLSELVGRIRASIENSGSPLISEEFPKKRQLAYTMTRTLSGKRQKYDSAYFGWFKFEMPPESIGKLQDSLREEVDVLRFLVVQTLREHTIVPKRIVVPKKPEIAKPAGEESAPVSDEELDKSIEKLMA